VIGIAVIAISAVGTMILVVVFFDQWWGFICDVCGRRRKREGGGKEELVPDWERGTWEFKVEKDILPAYPSFGSPPARAQNSNTFPDSLTLPTVESLEDNGQVFSTQGVPYGSSERRLKQFSPSGVVSEVTTNKSHSLLSRSNTQKSTITEDAYGGLAA
jgi:hypothetical protein